MKASFSLSVCILPAILIARIVGNDFCRCLLLFSAWVKSETLFHVSVRVRCTRNSIPVSENSLYVDVMSGHVRSQMADSVPLVCQALL
jgi:hypothetical protein